MLPDVFWSRTHIDLLASASNSSLLTRLFSQDFTLSLSPKLRAPKKKKKKVEPRFLFIFHFQSYAFTFFFFEVHCVVLIYAGKWAFGSTRAHSDGRLTSAAWRLSRSLQQRWCLSISYNSVFFSGFSVSDIVHTMMDVSLSTESSNMSSELRLSFWLKRLLDPLVSDKRTVMVPSLAFFTGPADALRSTPTSLFVSEPAECLCS